jgi:hypothetical protein
MIVKDIDITTSPLSPDRTCVRAEVICNDPSMPPEIYWIDVPRVYSDYLNDSGNPWLTLLLPVAIHLGERLIISKPVDHELFINVHELMRIWNCWYPDLKPVPIEAEVRQQQIGRSTGPTAAFFSGGVDAWFTLLTHNGEDHRPDRIQIDDALCVWGLDIRLENPGEFRALRDALVHAISGFRAEFLEVATNLQQTKWFTKADWGRVAHGSVLASVGHALSGRYARVLVPSTHRYDDPVPWGSHPLTDPLLSSSLTKIIHDGAGFSRVEKTEALLKCDAALKSLQVCWDTRAYRNCEACSKCYRTMTTLFLLGALDRCPRFSARTIDTKKLAMVFARDDSDRAFLREVRGLALRTGHRHIVRAIDRSFRHSRRLDLSQRWAKRLLSLASSKWQRRLDWRIERLLLRNSIL